MIAIMDGVKRQFPTDRHGVESGDADADQREFFLEILDLEVRLPVAELVLDYRPGSVGRCHCWSAEKKLCPKNTLWTGLWSP